MSTAGVATLRRAPYVRLPLERGGAPVRVLLVWTRSPASTVWHLATEGGRTLCGHQAAGPWLIRAGRELPADAKRFPCTNCTRIRQASYMP